MAIIYWVKLKDLKSYVDIELGLEMSFYFSIKIKFYECFKSYMKKILNSNISRVIPHCVNIQGTPCTIIYIYIYAVHAVAVCRFSKNADGARIIEHHKFTTHYYVTSRWMTAICFRLG